MTSADASLKAFEKIQPLLLELFPANDKDGSATIDADALLDFLTGIIAGLIYNKTSRGHDYALLHFSRDLSQLLFDMATRPPGESVQ